jgi:hypothetical protein
MTICEGETSERAPLKFCIGCANCEEEKKKKGKRKEMIFNAKLEIFLIHVSYHYVESIETLQTPPQKVVFGCWMASYAPTCFFK